MSNLPHPLGDSSSGDLFYPGSPDVIAADIPGAKGSRAVEFGEDGQSAAVNRGLYALGKNDEYQELRIEQTFPMPSLLSFTPSGGNGGSYTFSGGKSVFVGFSGWLPETQNVRNSLISVLDENYNELLSVGGIPGYRVVVKEILDAPAGSTVVGGDFQTDPHITFRLVHPVTGGPSADYTIPDGTNVILSFGKQASIDEMVGTIADEVRASWFLEHNRNGLHSGAFLTDGSRSATADFYMAGNGLLEVGVVGNYPAVPIELYGSGGTGAHVRLRSTGNIQFDDQWLASWVNLSEAGHTSLWGTENQSIIGMLNSGNLIDQSLRDDWYDTNICSVWASSITFNGTTGAIDWDSFDYIKNGEIVNIASGSVTPTFDSDRMLVVRGGTVQQVAFLTDEDLPLFAFHFDSSEAPNGYTNVNGYSRDVRRHLKGRINNLEVTVGSGVCADFRDLQTALDFVAYVGQWTGGTLVPGNPKIKIVSRYAASGELQVRCPVTIEGEDATACVVTTSNSVSDFGLNCNGHRVDVRNLTFMCGFYTADGASAIADPGNGSVFKDLFFEKSSSGNYSYAHLFEFTSTHGIRNWVTLDNIMAPNLFFPACGGFIKADHYLGGSTVQNCVVCGKPSMLKSFVDVTGGNRYLNNQFINFADPGIKLGNQSIFDGNYCVGSSSSVDHISICRPTGDGTGEHWTKITNNYFYQGDECINVDGVVPNSVDLDLQIHNNTFQGVWDCVRCDVSVGKFTAYSSIKMIGNTAVDVSSYFFYAYHLSNTFICDNYMKDVYWPFSLNNGCTRAIVDNNVMYDIASSGYSMAWNNQAVSDRESFKFTNNFVKLSASGSATVLYLDGWHAQIEGNVFCRTTSPAYWIDSTTARGHKVIGNDFGETSAHTVQYSNVYGKSTSVETGLVVADNHFEGTTAINYAALHVEGFQGANIHGNVFSPTDLGVSAGSAIEVRTKVVGTEFTPHNTSITGNVIMYFDCNGIDASMHNAIRITKAPGTIAIVTGCTVSNNVVFACGSTSLSNTYLIFIDARASISGNSMSWNKGGPTGQFRHIIAIEPSIIIGNYIFLDFEFGSPNAQYNVGIVANGGCSIVGNHIQFQGDASAGSGLLSATGIEGGYTGTLIACNYISDWTKDVGDIAYGIALQGTVVKCLVIGNIALRGEIDCSSATATSMVIGNLADDGTLPGTAVTSGNL